MKKRIHVLYSGKVQGVGFRYATQDIGRDLSIVGWVKNLGDGRVEAVAEAEEEVLKNFLSRIKSYFQQYIQKAEITWQESTAEFEDFSIKFF